MAGGEWDERWLPRRLLQPRLNCSAPPPPCLQPAEGNYTLTQPLTVTRGGVVLRGDGPARTTLYIPVSLSDVFSGTWVMGEDGARVGPAGRTGAGRGRLHPRSILRWRDACPLLSLVT